MNGALKTELLARPVLQADGTRRSAPALFDGRQSGDGGYMYGMGAFLADGGDVTDDEKRDRYREALDGLVERRATEFKGLEWDATTEKALTALKLASHVKKMKAAR